MSAEELDTVLRHLRKLAGARTPAASDAWLLDRFLAHGDEAAFAVLVARHGPMVWGVCRRVLADPNDAEDAFQATFLVLVRRARSLDRLGSLAAWLHGVARRVASRVRTGRRRERPLTEEVPAMSAADPLTEAARQELRRLLDEELGRLPEKYRGPVLLCDVEGNTYEEAARQLGYPPGSMSWRLARGRDLLRRGLERRGVALSAGALAAVLVEEASATVPAAVAAATVRAALLVTAGAALPAPVAVLVDATAGALAVARLKALAALLALGLLVAGAGVAAQWPATAESAPPSEGEQAQQAEQSPPGKEPVAEKAVPRVDQQGDPLPAGALARLGTLRFRHGTFIDALAFSPDGKLLATFARDERVRVWDAATGKQVRALTMPWYTYDVEVRFSPDGKTLVARTSGGRGLVRAWDVAAGRKLLDITSTDRLMNWFAIAPDGKVLVAVTGKHIEAWDLASGKQLRQYDNPTQWAGGLGYAADGRLIVIDGRKAPFQLYDVAAGKQLGRCEGHQGPSTNTFVFSPDGKLAASTGDEKDPTVRLWDPTSGKERLALSGHTKGVYSLAFSGDGKLLASVSLDETVRVWDTATGKERHRHTGPGGTQLGIALSPDGKSLWVRGAEYAVRLIDTATGKDLLPPGHSYPARYIACAPDGKTVWSAAEGPIFGWDMATGKLLHTFQHHLYPGAWFAPDGRTARFFGEGGTIREVDLLKGRVVRTWQWKGNGYLGLIFSPDGTRLEASKQIEDRGKGEYLLSVWELAAVKEPLRVGKLETGGGYWPTFAPDGRLLVRDGDAARLWDPAAGTEMTGPAFKRKGEWSSAYTFAPDGRLLLNVWREDTTLWEVLTGKPIGRLDGLHRPRPSLRPSDGSLVTAFSADGRLLATGGTDGEVQLWDVPALKLIATLTGHTCDLEALAFAPDGKRLVSSSQDTTLLVWDMTPFTTREPVSRELTADERQRLWTDLAGDSAAAAHGAVWALVAGRDRTVAFLKERLRPASETDSKRIDRLIADLDDDRFAVREAAAKELARQGKVAEPALKRVLKGPSSAEVRRRAEDLLARMKQFALPSEDLQALRALAVLERIDSENARRLLEQLTRGQPDAPLTREAKAVQRRLQRSQDRGPKGGR